MLNRGITIDTFFWKADPIWSYFQDLPSQVSESSPPIKLHSKQLLTDRSLELILKYGSSIYQQRQAR